MVRSTPEPTGSDMPAGGQDGGTSPERPRPRRGEPGRRQRRNRHRGSLPIGEAFVSRLGPADGERFVTMDDIDPMADVPPPPPLDTVIDDLRFVALDCETTGQSPHRLVELGAVAFTMHEVIEKLETLVHSNDRINRFAERIHRITSNSLAGSPPIEPVIERFRHFAGASVLVEHSADAFDTRLITRTAGDAWPVVNLDTSRLAGRLWDLRDTIGLERLCRELGVTHRRPHHALADAEATAECLIALIRLGETKFDWRTLADLVEVGQPPPPRPAPGDGAARPVRSVGSTGPRAPGEGAPRRRRRGGRKRRGGLGGAPPGTPDDGRAANAAGPDDSPPAGGAPPGFDSA